MRTKNIGRKFNEDGSVRFFPGNTLICKIKEGSAVYPLLTAISDQYKALTGAHKYAFLPPESFHMTMIQGVCDQDRRKALWSRYLPLDTPLEAVDDYFEEQFKSVPRLAETRMRFDYIDYSKDIIIIWLVPDSDGDTENLKRYRNQVSEALGIRFPDHDSYGFHISIAYKLWKLTEEEEREISYITEQLNQRCRAEFPSFILNPPEITYFKDMFYFSSERIERMVPKEMKMYADSDIAGN